MNHILTGNIWEQISKRTNSSNRRIAAISYVSTDRYIKFRKGDILVCDASNKAISSGKTSATVISKLHQKGVKLYSNSQLHSKLLIFGKYSLIGSNNLSESSATILQEIALLTSNSSIRSQSAAFIYFLIDNSEEIDINFIKRILKIKVKRGHLTKINKRKSINLGNRTWVIRTYELDPEKYEKENKYVEKAESEIMESNHISDPENIGWIRWTGKCNFRNNAKEGDTIIDMTSIRKGKQITIWPPTSIIKRQDHKDWTRFYYEIHDDYEIISWTDFYKRLKNVGITSIKKNSTKLLNERDSIIIESVWHND